MSVSRHEQDGFDMPSWPAQQLCQPPNRKHGSDCAGFRIGPSSKAASRRALGGLQVSLPETESEEVQFGQTFSNLHIQVDRSGLALQSFLSTG